MTEGLDYCTNDCMSWTWDSHPAVEEYAQVLRPCEALSTSRLQRASRSSGRIQYVNSFRLLPDSMHHHITSNIIVEKMFCFCNCRAFDLICYTRKKQSHPIAIFPMRFTLHFANVLSLDRYSKRSWWSSWKWWSNVEFTQQRQPHELDIFISLCFSPEMI